MDAKRKTDGKVDLSRRGFLGGVIGLTACAGCRWAMPGEFAAMRPNLRLGLLADIHVCAEDGDFKKFGDARMFERALRWFREQGVDGVVIAGDMADNGMTSQLRKVANAWNRVFPDGRDESGRPVERLFVYGNHDLEGQHYDGYDKRFFEKDSFRRGMIATDPARAWESVFGEPYAPIWMKRVKGYQIIGAHWLNGKWDGIADLEPWFKAHADEIDRDKPFFFIQHPHPKDTCFGPNAWGHDAGYATRALSAYPNAVAFSGHAHCSATDDRFIWQGAFTSIGLGSLRFGSCDSVARLAPEGAKLEDGGPRWNVRQGMLLDVYDTEMVLACRDFVHNEPLRRDLVIPLPASAERPFAFEPREKAAGKPRFPADAALVATRGEKTVALAFPAARGRARVMGYVLTVTKPDGSAENICFVQPGFDFARHRAAAKVAVEVAAERIPDGSALSLVAVNCFGGRSKPLKG